MPCVDILFLLKPVKFILTTLQFLLRMFLEKLAVALRYSLQFHIYIYPFQCAKKVVSDSPGLVHYCRFGLVNSVFNLPDGQVMFFD